MSRSGLTFLVAAVVLALGVIGVYIAGRIIPFDTTGEGANPENYPW